MKLSREAKPISSADLLVCFPSRSHLHLMPNPLCSPARGPDRRPHRHRRRKSAESPVVWAKGKAILGSEMSEPSSPKVTCAGQIKSRPGSGKSWESVIEEIERMRKSRRRRRFGWVESLGFKKDLMQFLTCLRRFKFDFRCFRAFPETELTSEEEEEEEEGNERSSRAPFSKWVMVLEENDEVGIDDGSSVELLAPPDNALVLMRCRSAPAKSWVELEEEEEEEEEEEVKVKKSLKWLMEEENRETLRQDLLSRSRSWRV